MLIAAPRPERPEFVFIPVGPAAEGFCQQLIAEFRRKGAHCDMAFRGNLKKRMQKADAANASYVVICGDDEIEAGEITIRSLKSGEQIRRKLSDLDRSESAGRNYFLATVLDGIDGIKTPA